jgi:hypothetical protein
MAAKKKVAEVTMSHTKSTKNQERFDNVDPDGSPQNLYIMKSLVGTPVPAKVTVTVTEA